MQNEFQFYKQKITINLVQNKAMQMKEILITYKGTHSQKAQGRIVPCQC